MKICLSPMRSDETLNVSVAGDVLTINGEAFDLSGIPDGAILPRETMDCRWFGSDIERIGGELQLTLILPHGADAPQETLFPASLDVIAEGPINLPPHDGPVHEDDMTLPPMAQ